MPDGGYVAGNNGYGDDIKATCIPAAIVPAGGLITGVLAIFFQKSATIGTHGTSTISVNILNGDTLTGPTGASIATATASLSAITVMTNTTMQIPYLFNFTTSVAAPTAGFFASINLPSTTGDTVALWCTKAAAGTPNYAWDHNPGNTNATKWLAYSNPIDWNQSTSLTLLPIICSSTGIHNNILEASLALFPNPSNGQFNFAVALPAATNLTINVVNTIGQIGRAHV